MTTEAPRITPLKPFLYLSNDKFSNRPRIHPAIEMTTSIDMFIIANVLLNKDDRRIPRNVMTKKKSVMRQAGTSR